MRLRAFRHAKALASGGEAFLAALDTLWTRFGEDAASFLEGYGGIDRRFYVKLYEERVGRDLAMANDEEFRDRYPRGYEITEVPRFRNDVSGWREFLDSIARQLCLEDTRSRPRSRLLHAIRDAVEESDASQAIFDDAERLLQFLRDAWQKSGRVAGVPVGAVRLIADYHLR